MSSLSVLDGEYVLEKTDGGAVARLSERIMCRACWFYEKVEI